MRKISDESKIIVSYSILFEEKVIYSNKNETLNLKEKNSLNYIIKKILKDKDENYSGTFFIKEKQQKEELLIIDAEEYPGIKFKEDTIIRLGTENKIYGYIMKIENNKIFIDIDEPFLKKTIELKIKVLKILEE